MKTRNLFALGGLAAGLLFVPSTAEAAGEANGFASETQLILSANRLVPVVSFNSTKVTDTNNGRTNKTTDTGTATSILFGTDIAGGAHAQSVPRVGVDVSIAATHITVGGDLAFAFTLGGSHETERNENNTTVTTKRDSPSTTLIGFAPRVGYVLPLGDIFAFWPRAGFGFYSVRVSTEDQNNNNTIKSTNHDTIFSLDLDPQFAIVPIEHFFIMVGPILNIPLTGSRSTEVVNGATTVTTDNDLTVWHFGINAAIGGWFNL